MSENQNPEEPMIIKTDRPHTVSMPEGTNIAVGKKGEAGAPVVRKVMADGESNVAENVVMDGGVSSSKDPSKDVMAKGENNKGYQSKEECAGSFCSSAQRSGCAAPKQKIDRCQPTRQHPQN